MDNELLEENERLRQEIEELKTTIESLTTGNQSIANELRTEDRYAIFLYIMIKEVVNDTGILAEMIESTEILKNPKLNPLMELSMNEYLELLDPVEATQFAGLTVFELDDSINKESTWLMIKGEEFTCKGPEGSNCGCQLFHKEYSLDVNKVVYVCNSCGLQYEAE